MSFNTHQKINSMKNLYLSLILVLLQSIGYSQDRMLSELISIPVEIKSTQDGLVLESGQTKTSFEGFSLIAISKVELKQADLTVQYQINHPDPEVEYRLSMALEGENGTINYADYKQLVNGQTQGTLQWRDILEGQIDIGKEYQLLIRTDVFGKVCADVPERKLSKDLPYMGAAVIGLGAIGIGQIFRIQSQNKEDEYQQIWKDGGTATLDDAREDFETYRNLTYTGLGILAIDGVLYWLKQRKYRKSTARFRTFCTDKKTIDIHPVYTPSSDFGFQLKLKF